MRIIVDLIRCQSYGQCVFAAPTVFRFAGEHALVSGERGLEFDYAPDDALREQVERAAAACPVQAIRIGLPDVPAPAAPPEAIARQASIERRPPQRGLLRSRSSSSAPPWPGCAPPRRCARRASPAR